MIHQEFCKRETDRLDRKRFEEEARVLNTESRFIKKNAVLLEETR